MLYEPREDSYLLQKYVEKYCPPGFLVLDMGTGTGIQAFTAAKKAKKVIACDINPDAVKTAALTASIEKIKNIEFVESDLFSNVKGKFDLIIFNPPYLPEEKNVEDLALYSAKRGTETTVKFLAQAADYLMPEGIILITSSSLANQNKVKEAIQQSLLVSEVLETQHIFFEDIFVLLIKKSMLLMELEKKGINHSMIYARGKRGVIIKAIIHGKTIAIKIKKPESMALSTIENEARFLSKLNKYEIGPKLVLYTGNFLMYEFVEGVFIEEFFTKNSKPKIIRMLKIIFSQLYKMDRLGINKFEMHHPLKHIIIDKKPVLIDFERARYTDDPKNITQFCDYLISESVLRIFKSKKIHISKTRMIALAKKYKHQPTLENYKKINDLIK